LEKTVLLGELALDGRVRPVRGVLRAVITGSFGEVGISYVATSVIAVV
jgi:predicted ATPase with chaperone activity